MVSLVDADGNPQITLGVTLGYACWPLAWLLGIPAAECMEAGRLIGLKTVANEFIAYDQLGRAEVGPDGLSQRTVDILTYALAGFSNFGAIGIQVGGILEALRVIYGGDPGLGIILVPIGAAFLLVGVLIIAWKSTFRPR